MVFFNWEALEHPLKELQKAQPLHPLLTGKPCSNVPLAISLSSMKPLIHPGVTPENPIISVASSLHTSVVVTVSADGTASVWDTSLELKNLYEWNTRTGDIIIDRKKSNPVNLKSLDEQEECETHGRVRKSFLVQCTPIKTEQLTQNETKNAKWVDWCTPGIEVNTQFLT